LLFVANFLHDVSLCFPAASLKLLGKTCLHYVLAPDQAAPAEVLAVMQQQRPRHHSSRAGSSAASTGQQAAADASGAALFSFAKGMAHVTKHVINAQVRALQARCQQCGGCGTPLVWCWQTIRKQPESHKML
jgi:hypothetical protein